MCPVYHLCTLVAEFVSKPVRVGHDSRAAPWGTTLSTSHLPVRALDGKSSIGSEGAVSTMTSADNMETSADKMDDIKGLVEQKLDEAEPLVDQVTEKARELTEDAKEKAAVLAEKVMDKAEPLIETIREKAEPLVEKATEGRKHSTS